MNAYGIWDSMKWKMVNHNINNGTVKIENDLAFDTTHVESYSSFTTVEENNNNEKKHKKAVCKLSKPCSCSNKEMCDHP